MKKNLISIIILCITMLLALSGCGSSTPGVVTITELSSGKFYNFPTDENFMRGSANRIVIKAPEGAQIRIELYCPTCGESPVVVEYTCDSRKINSIRCKGGLFHISECFFFEIEPAIEGELYCFHKYPN